MDENALRAVGIDYDAALARFMGKQAIYEKYLRKLPEDAHMKAAWTALEQQDEAELLEQVHAIKGPVSYTHLRAHETGRNLVCRLLLEKKKQKQERCM